MTAPESPFNVALFLYKQMNQQRRLAKIWRAIARRHLSRLRDAEREADMWYYSRFDINDGESNP
jgi:hypothetical protein